MRYSYTNISKVSHSIPLLSENKTSIRHIFIRPEEVIELSYPGLDLYVPSIFLRNVIGREIGFISKPVAALPVVEPVVEHVVEPVVEVIIEEATEPVSEELVIIEEPAVEKVVATPKAAKAYPKKQTTTTKKKLADKTKKN